MLADYLTRGVKAGLVAGLVFGLFMAIVANPIVVAADELNHAATESVDGHDHADGGHADGGPGDGDHGHSTAVSLAVNKTVSVISGGLWAVLLGGVCFGFVFYLLEPAIPGTGATKSYVLGAAGFISVSGAPWLVLPPAAPGAPQSLPVESRLLLYGGMMVAGAVVCLLGGRLYNRLEASAGRPVAAVAGVAPLGLLAIPTALAPANTVQSTLPAELQAGVVGLFVFGQLLLWLALAATHAQLQPAAERTAEQPSSASDSPVTAD